jgi:hypothetical protein
MRAPAGMDHNDTASRGRLRLVRVGLMLVLLLAAQGVLVPVASADQLVVDDADARVRITGAWQQSSSTPGFYGGDYLFHVPGRGTASVSWPFPTDGSPGQYRVFARWSSGSNRASVATYTVRSDAGSVDVHFDQRTGGSRWQALGTFAFAPGQSQGVVLSDRADGVVIADAIAWEGPVDTRHTVDLAAPLDPPATQPLQRAVDAGDEPWRLDPLEAARADATSFGFAPTDPMHLVETSAGYARVQADHAGARYEIRVVQPARLGRLGIWVVSKIDGPL